jgi:hypothetical protein
MQIHSVGIDLGKTTLSPCSSRHSRKGAAEEEVYSAQLITFTANPGWRCEPAHSAS